MIRFLKAHLSLFMRLSLAICYVWFGALKFFPSFSPAESLAKGTINHLMFGILPSNLTILLLAGWEVCIGIGLVLNFKPKIVIGSALVHMVFTFTPLFFFTEICFTNPPFGFSIVGQYIFKNLVFICALIYLYPDNKPK